MKQNQNIKWTISDVFDSKSGFWIFDDSEIEDYHAQSFILKHKKKFDLFDKFLVFIFIVYVLSDIFI